MVTPSWGILPHVTHGSFDDEHDRLAPINAERTVAAGAAEDQELVNVQASHQIGRIQ